MRLPHVNVEVRVRSGIASLVLALTKMDARQKSNLSLPVPRRPCCIPAELISLRSLAWIVLSSLLACGALLLTRCEGGTSDVLHQLSREHLTKPPLPLHLTSNQIANTHIPLNGSCPVLMRHVFGPLDESFVSGLKKLDNHKLMYCELPKNGTLRLVKLLRKGFAYVS